MTDSMQTTAGARLAGRTAILSGATTGEIGRAIARYVLREGANLVMTDRSREALEAFVQTLTEEGFAPASMTPVAAHAADAEACRGVVQTALEVYGRLDVLINNGGEPGPFSTVENVPITEGDARAQGTETMMDSAMDVLGGPWNMSRAAVPHMSTGGSIINISTIFSRTRYFGRTPYIVPKSGLNALSLGLAREVGRDLGLRVNTVFPGPTESDRIDRVFASMDALQGQEPGETSKTFRALMTHRRADAEGNLDLRYVTTKDVANTVLFLASEESLAFSGHSFEPTNGMQVPAQSRSKLVSWPDNRLVDLRDRVVLVLGGSDIGETLTFAERNQIRGAEVVLAFRTLDGVSQARATIQARGLGPFRLVHLDPLRPEIAERAFGFVRDHYDRLDGVIVLPVTANGEHGYTLTTATDADAEAFIRNEIVAPVAFAGALTRALRSWPGMSQAPAVAFVTNPSDGHSNRLNDIKRAAVEGLIRVWRDEERHAVKKGERAFACLPNQIVRFDNDEPDNLAFAADWTATLTNRVRKMDPINLWVPESIKRATGKSRTPMAIQRVLPGLHHGRTAVITGGSLGIGMQLGRFLALAGARVLLSARSEGKLKQAQEEIIAELRAIGYAAPEERVFILSGVDVGKEEALQRLVDHSLELFGHVDILINNAGISGAEEMVVDMELDDWNWTQTANLISNYSLIRKYAPHMKARGRGHILNVSSYFGGEKYLAVAYPNRADYSVSKAGQRSLAEILSRHLGPEIQINALAPGPVDGARLRGTPDSPGLFLRRGLLILDNKRLNKVHQALLESRAEGCTIGDCLQLLAVNEIAKIDQSSMPGPLKKLLARVRDERATAVSSQFLLNATIAPKLAARLVHGGLLASAAKDRFLETFVEPPSPFFDDRDVQRAADRIEAGIIDRLHLKTMPSDEAVGLSTVFSLADAIVSGETFHPSGGLKFERSVTEGELMSRPNEEDLARLEGKHVVLIGEAMKEELVAIGRGFLERRVAKLTLLTRTEEAAAELQRRFGEVDGTVSARAVGDEVEAGLDATLAELGHVDVVVSTPFARLPMKALAAEANAPWDRVLSRDDFAGLIRDHLTHHFRVGKRAALWPRCQIVLVTPDTSRASTREEFALALFIKNSLHAFTVTLGVEGERLPTEPAVNQVQLTRRARTEEPGNEQELSEERQRMVAAVLLCAVPAPSPRESRYLARIFRGNAVTV
jgi:malonyl-CoA reductase/3-hydroxypropionate dehydrogenase (NADP+)